MQKGRPKNLVRTQRITLSLLPEHLKMLYELAELSGLSKSKIVAAAVKHFYDHCTER